MGLRMHIFYFVITLFVFSILVTSIRTFAVEEIWEDYKSMGEMVKDIRNGDKDDDNVDYNKFKNSTVYRDAKEDVRKCIDLANKVGEKLGDYEIVQCFKNTNYFKEKYVDDKVQNKQEVDVQKTTIQNMTQDKSTVGADDQEQEQIQNEGEQSTFDTSSKNITANNLINELLRTGKFTEDEAKEFVGRNVLNRANVASTTNDTRTNDAKSIATDEQIEEQEQQELKQVNHNQNQTKPQLLANETQTPISRSDSNSTEGCDSSYPEICITKYSAKLICADIPFRNFKVLLPDPHGFDSDGDGVGCEE